MQDSSWKLGAAVAVLLVLCSRVPCAGQFIDRFAFKTNALEWVLTVPNVGAEFDLSSSEYNRNTIGLTLKYNWRTYHKYAPPYVFDVFDIRPEFRHYYRQKPLSNPKGKQSFIDFFTTGERRNPKSWRAYYIGGYVDYASWAFKFSPTGMQGSSFGAGASFGFEIPLYCYEKFAIDLDLGLSIGFQVARYENFTYSSEGDCYLPCTEYVHPYHFVPFPVPTELRVAFNFRPVSVKEKYIKDDPEKKTCALVSEDVKTSFASINKDNFDGTLSARQKEEYEADPAKYREDFEAYLDEQVRLVLSNNVHGRGLSEKHEKAFERSIGRQKSKILSDFASQAKTSSAPKDKAAAPKDKGKKSPKTKDETQQ